MFPGKIRVFSATTGNRGNILVAMADGARRVGLDCDVVAGFDYNACDVAVMWGLVKQKTGRSWLSKRRQQLRNEIVDKHRGPIVMMEAPVMGRNVKPHTNRPWLIKKLFPKNGRWTPRFLSSPRSIIDPYSHYRVGLGGFPDDGGMALSDFCRGRWPKLAEKLELPHPKQFRLEGQNIVVIGQVPGDASLRGVDIHQWMIDTCLRLKQITDRPIVVRPHPLAKTFESSGVREHLENTGIVIDDVSRPLSTTLSDAWAVVTYSSGAAVDALLAGVPAVAMSTASFAWEVTDHSLESVVNPTLHARMDWLEKLAASQWCADEIARGDVWEPLLRAIAAEVGQQAAA